MAAASRFDEVSDEFLNSLLDKSVPNATKKSTKYGMKIFNGKKTMKTMRVLNCSRVDIFRAQTMKAS